MSVSFTVGNQQHTHTHVESIAPIIREAFFFHHGVCVDPQAPTHGERIRSLLATYRRRLNILAPLILLPHLRKRWLKVGALLNSLEECTGGLSLSAVEEIVGEVQESVAPLAFQVEE